MRWMITPGWKGNLLALVAGALTPLAFAPFNLWPLELVSIAVFYLSLRELSAGWALLRGWCYGLGVFLAGTSWVYVSIHDYGAASVPLAAGLTFGFCAGIALLFALPAWLWALCLRRNHAPIMDALAFAALWFGLEVFRSWCLTGFPWLFAGYSQMDAPLSGLAPVGGVWLLSFSLALTAALIVNALGFVRNPGSLVAGLILLATPWVAASIFKGQVWTTPLGQPLKVSAIQGNIAQELKWDPKHVQETLALYREMTVREGRTDLIVWPENAVPVLKEYAESYLKEVTGIANQRGAALITGIPVRERDDQGQDRFYNAVVVSGEGSGTYYKQKLVPFGEYVPLQEQLRGLIEFFNLPMSDFVPGPSHQSLLIAKGYKIAPFICYEVVYPEFVAAAAARSDLLLTISNDTWFGKSVGPQQHLQMARMRALESGRWMIRGTNNGITALIDPFGRLTTQIPPYQLAVLHGTVVPMEGLTPYLKWRLWPLAILCGLLGAWAVIRRLMERSRQVF
ncbi:apolipoprotein N-acyltransferase [Pseudomonas duriflava]|uniref:Apolipoprotein N-acyltransferase n=1 Tax=Pseudomonas duriflava TaxID=459528 RepID=A0A562QBX3_9PSED|nr:apolipoprotein N-acyltransferase [Pseudomonas duriflava]TWI54251.1 apolipoprotein N-acyltransferase [Pseudomonas duriflava]